MELTTTWDDTYEDKINLDEAKFIFQQAEIKLKDTIDTSQLIVSRTVAIAGISISIMVAIVAYLFTNWSSSTVDIYSLLLVKIAACYFFVLNIIIITNFHPSKYNIQGINPSALITKHFFGGNFENTLENPSVRLLEFYKVAITGYEKSINQNKDTNLKRWGLFRWALWLLTLSPLVILFVYILIIICR